MGEASYILKVVNRRPGRNSEWTNKTLIDWKLHSEDGLLKIKNESLPGSYLSCWTISKLLGSIIFHLRFTDGRGVE